MSILGTYPREAFGAFMLSTAAFFAGLGLLVGPSSPLSGTASATTVITRARPALGAPPAPEPLQFKDVTVQDARTINAAMPFDISSNPKARAFAPKFADATQEGRALDCLTAAVYYEAAIEAADGQRAVAQVVLNRLRHPAYPKTVCGVVFQGQERSTGCQFTFTCDGALARAPNPALWTRARAIAWAALSGEVFAPVGWATHYHTDWVVPYWASSLAKATKVGTHIFYRWLGGWGRAPAFTGRYGGTEPGVAKMAALSGAHAGALVDVAVASDAALDALAMGDDIVIEAKAPDANGAERVTMRLNTIAGGTPNALAAAQAGTLASKAAAAKPAETPAQTKVPWELRWALTGAGPATPEAALGTPVASKTNATKTGVPVAGTAKLALPKECLTTPKQTTVVVPGGGGASMTVRERCGA